MGVAAVCRTLLKAVVGTLGSSTVELNDSYLHQTM